MAFTSDRDNGNMQIFTMDINGGSQTNVSNNACDEIEPSWSPDSTQLVFVSKCSGKSQLVEMHANGTNRVVISDNATVNDEQPAWSPSGALIAFSSDRTGKRQIFDMAANGTGVMDLSNNTSSDSKPSWKPDGSALAFQTDRLGLAQIWVMDADGSSQSPLLTPSPTGKSDTNPAWSPDGTKVAFSRTMQPNSREIETEVVTVTNGALADVTNNPAVDDQPDWGPQAGSPVVPESAIAVALPLSGLGLMVGGVIVARRRSPRSHAAI